MHRLDKPNEVRGAYQLTKGRLTFTTGDAAMTQRLEADRAAGRTSTVCLLAADPLEEFVGQLESVKLIKAGRPQSWEVVMIGSGAKRRKRS